MKAKLFKRPALMLCTLAVLCLAITAVLSASPTYAITQSVNDWAGLQAAFADPTVDVIELSNNITRTLAPVINDLAPLTRDLTIKSAAGNRFTLDLGTSATAANASIRLNAVLVPTTLRLENINVVKTASNNAVYGTAANTANWRIEIEDVTTGTTTTQRGLIDAERAAVAVYGTENNLRIEQNGFNHINAMHFEMTAGAEMYVGTRVSTSGTSDACISINNGGSVILRPDAELTVENLNGTSSTTANGNTSHAMSAGIFGNIASFEMEARSRLTINATFICYRSYASGATASMKDGAYFKALNIGGANSNGAVSLSVDYADTRTAAATYFTVEGEGTELICESDSNNTINHGTALRLMGQNSCMTVKDGAKLTSTGQRNSAFQLFGDGSSLVVKDGAEANFEQIGGTYDLGAAIRFRLTGGMTFLIDDGKVNVIQRDANNNGTSGIRMYGGNNSIRVTNGGEFFLRNYGSGAPQDGTGSASNQGIYYTASGGNPETFFLSGYGSKVEIISDWGPGLVTDSNGSLDVDASDGAIFIVNGRTSGAGAGAIYSSAAGCPLSFTLDNPLYFDIRNYRPGGGPAVYSVCNAGNANENFLALTNSDLSVWNVKNNGASNPAGLAATSQYFEGSPSRAWTLLNTHVRGRWIQFINNLPYNVTTNPYAPQNDYPNFSNNSTSATVNATTGNFVNIGTYSRISANNAKPLIDNLRKPTDADKYLHGHASVPEGLQGIRDAWTDEVYVTVQVKDDKGNIVPIKDMYGNYGNTAEWVTIGMDDLNPDGVTVYDAPPDGGVFKIPYIPQNPAAHAYVPDYLETPSAGDLCFLPAGYTFEVLSAYRSSLGSKTQQLAAVPPDPKAPRVHQSDYAMDIEGPLKEALDGDVFVTCIDKTPPPPAVIDGEMDDVPKLTIPEGSQVVSGASPEKGSANGDVKAIIAVKRAPGDFEIVTTDGTPVGSGGVPVITDVNCTTGLWELTIPSYLTLALGDVIQVYLIDSAGNANQKDSREFHDALDATDDAFPAGTIAHVVESAFILHIRQIVHNPGSTAMRAWPGAGYTKITDQRSNMLIPPKKYNVITSAGFSNAAEYTTVELKGVFKNNTVTIQNVVPQYFLPAGYQISPAAPVSLAPSNAPNANAIQVDTDREYWVTVFLSPVSFGTARYAGGIVDHHFGIVTG